MKHRTLDACLQEYAQGIDGCQLILRLHQGGAIDRNRSTRNRIISKQHPSSPVSSILFFAQSIPPDSPDFVNCIVTLCASIAFQPHAYSSFSPVTVRTWVIASGERSSMICMKLISANLAARLRSKGTGLEGST